MPRWRSAPAHGVELPIAAQVDALLQGHITAEAAVGVLMGRRQRAESDAAALSERAAGVGGAC